MKPLHSISTPQGIIAAIAVDQRKSLRPMIGDATDDQLADFKQAVVEALSPHASAVLLDPEYGRPAMEHRASSSGLLVTYESDGFDNPRPHRMLALMPEYSVPPPVRSGGAGHQDPALLVAHGGWRGANEEKRVLIERIGYECEAAGVPFLLEPVVYDPGRADARGVDFGAPQTPAGARYYRGVFPSPCTRWTCSRWSSR